MNERRAGRRYALSTPVEYRTVLEKIEMAGAGITVNISSSGVLVRTSTLIPVGVHVEIDVVWPVRSDGRQGLILQIIGRSVRTQGECFAIRILRHEFRHEAPVDAST